MEKDQPTWTKDNHRRENKDQAPHVPVNDGLEGADQIQKLTTLVAASPISALLTKEKAEKSTYLQREHRVTASEQSKVKQEPNSVITLPAESRGSSATSLHNTGLLDKTHHDAGPVKADDQARTKPDISIPDYPMMHGMWRAR